MPTHRSEDTLDAAVDQLVKMYITQDSAHHKTHSRYHHHRDMSLDLGHGHRSPHRASTSWLNTNAGFEPNIYKVKDYARPVHTPPSPKRHSLEAKPQRVVTFKDQVDAERSLPTPPASPVTEEKPVRDAAHRHSRFVAKLHLDTSKFTKKGSRPSKDATL